ncbi:MAG: 16S rRNA processing protein RimM [Raoultibacter sp.]
MGAWVSVAELVKAKTLEGGLVVRPAHGLPFLLQAGMSVTFVPPLLTAPKTAVVAEIALLKEDWHLVHFAGIDSIDAAEDVVGRFCLVRKSDLPLDYALCQPLWWQGFTVHDADRGLLGTISNVIENPAQHLVCVQGEAGEIMIPLVDEFVQAIDSAGKRLEVSVPQSLLDLAKG